MVHAFVKAFVQLPTGEFRRILWRSASLSFIVFALLGVVLWWLLSSPVFFGGEGWISLAENKILSGIIDLVGWATFGWLSWLLYPAVVSLFIGAFLEDVAKAVEMNHYSQDQPGTNMPVIRSIWLSSKFVLFLVFLNVLILPVYLMLLFFPLLSSLLFYVVNGYLLGREYFDLVALRHLDEEMVFRLRRRHRCRIFLTGLVIAVLLTVPLINLIASIVGLAAMVHVYKSLPAIPQNMVEDLE